MQDTMLDPKEASSPVQRPTKAQTGTVQHYLELEFPGQVTRTWWDRNLMAQVFEIAHGHGLRHIVIDCGFFQECPDYVAGLRESELTDYVRESLAPERCFLVKWHDGVMRIRSKPL
jgi:hypothetical protein